MSLFEPHTEVIPKGKSLKPTDFGKMVEIQEAEARIFTHYDVYIERPSDSISNTGERKQLEKKRWFRNSGQPERLQSGSRAGWPASQFLSE